MTAPIHVVGIGLDGAIGLTGSVQQIIQQATILVGSDRHLSYFPDHAADRIVLKELGVAIEQIHHRLTEAQLEQPRSQPFLIVILTSGDPLFFGFGRLLLAAFAPEQLTFHPHLSSVQLAFSRIKVPWQDAKLISVHGRSIEELTRALQQGCEKIALLTDPTNTPSAIAQHLLALDLPSHYQVWVCENLGGVEEQVRSFAPEVLVHRSIELTFAPLNVVILLRSNPPETVSFDLASLPVLGIADACFLSFSDRPGLMTKREVRLLALGELALQPRQVIWDIGAGTGSVSIEMARLCPASEIYAIEQTAAGVLLIEKNCQRFQVSSVKPIQGKAPLALTDLPAPDRIFIGGSGGNLAEILTVCGQRLQSKGVIVVAIATLEHLTTALNWLHQQSAQQSPQQSPQQWQHRELQIQLARAVPISNLTRWSPLNPVTLLILTRIG